VIGRESNNRPALQQPAQFDIHTRIEIQRRLSSGANLCWM
jgi:hypothetical protein